MISVSVIMPVYNTEKFVREAVESWLRQTLSEKELICIDDGSTDSSLQIIAEYSQNHQNIRVIEQDHQGAGVARNKGIEEAQGEFVCFLDSDDFYLDERALEILYTRVKKCQLKACAGLSQKFTDGLVEKDNPLRRLLGGQEEKRVLYEQYQYDYYYTCYLFERNLLIEHKIKFPPYLRFQDPPFLIQALYYAKEFNVVNIEFYGYRYMCKKANYTDRMILDLFSGLLYNLKFSKEHQLNILQKITIDRINKEYFDILYSGLKVTNKELIKKMIEAEELLRDLGESLEPWEFLFYSKTDEDKEKFIEYRCIKKMQKMLPYKTKIILYGAGEIGQLCYKSNLHMKYYEICLWVDHYKCGMQCMGKCLKDIKDIQSVEFNYILIAIQDKNISQKIKAQLINMRIDAYRILEWNN